ncbi:MAG TPA: serine hydrolase domain-containing protein [Longimicrobiales bacterium]
MAGGWLKRLAGVRGGPAQAALAAAALVLLLFILLALPFAPERLRTAVQREWERTQPPAGFPLTAVDSAARLVASQVAARVYPGAALAAGVGDRIQVLRGVGRLEWEASSPSVSPESTRYDLASLSKAVATTTAVLLLVQDGRIRLDEPVRRWLPEFYGRWKDRVTWRHLLTHTSGLPPGGRMSGSQPGERLASLLRTRLDSPPGTEVQYSDVGYIVLWTAAQRVAGEPLPRLLRRRVWNPLNMSATGYLPGQACQECAPTLTLHDGRPFRGEPADPTARELGGITGNAGLFSTAADLAHFAAMVASGGELDGVRIFRPDIVQQLFTQQPRAGRRTLGWDAFCPAEPPRPQVACRHPVAFGHYGWTGTSLWIDPRTRTWVVLLANRSYEVLKPKSMEAVREGVFADLSGEPLPPAPVTPALAPAAPPRAVAARATPRKAAHTSRLVAAAAHRHAGQLAAARRRHRSLAVAARGKRPGKHRSKVVARR